MKISFGNLLKLFKKTPKPLFDNVVIGKNSEVDKFCEVGEYTYIGHSCSITRTSIGRYCSIANNVTIGPGEHKLDKISTSLHIYPEIGFFELTENECNIGHDVWIGVDCIIRRGVKIGNGAVIGANSFVNSDIPDFCIAAGNPARIIRPRFNEEAIAHINQSNWWDCGPEEAKEIVHQLEKTCNITR